MKVNKERMNGCGAAAAGSYHNCYNNGIPFDSFFTEKNGKNVHLLLHIHFQLVMASLLQ